MADGGGRVGWYSSRRHALIPLDGRFHVPRSLRRALNSGRFQVRIDADFEGVLAGCSDRDQTWISDDLRDVYRALHQAGVARSLETWTDGQLAGGILGIVIGGAFIGESMFYREPNASKVALVRLVERLRACGFELLDAQVMSPHLERFGAFEVPEAEYLRQLGAAVLLSARLY